MLNYYHQVAIMLIAKGRIGLLSKFQNFETPPLGVARPLAATSGALPIRVDAMGDGGISNDRVRY